MSRQDSFEAFYADQHDIPVSAVSKYRWISQDGYRLPDIAKAYRNFCAGWDAREIQAEEDIEDLRLQARDDACRAES